MTDLYALSVARANLPVFPGTIHEQVVAAAYAAEAALRSVMPAIEFDYEKADETLRVVGAWQERNKTALGKALSDPAEESLPEQIRLQFNVGMAQSYIVASYVGACRGLAPWLSGRIGTEVQRGGLIDEAWAIKDAQMRLQIFGGIVRMKEQGYLDKLFMHPESLGAFGAFGLPPVAIAAIAIAVAAAAVAAYFIYSYYTHKGLEMHQRVIDEICTKAIREGDKSTQDNCLQISKGIIDATLNRPDPVSQTTQNLTNLALVAGAVYLAVMFGPMIVQHLRSRTS